MLEPPVTVLAFQKLWLLTPATNSGQRRKPQENPILFLENPGK